MQVPASDELTVTSAMPPKKKGHQSSKAASAPSGDVVEPTVAETPALTKADYGKNKTEKDAWTDEQEISLFKGMIRWKPVGSFSACASKKNFYT